MKLLISPVRFHVPAAPDTVAPICYCGQDRQENRGAIRGPPEPRLKVRSDERGDGVPPERTGVQGGCSGDAAGHTEQDPVSSRSETPTDRQYYAIQMGPSEGSLYFSSKDGGETEQTEVRGPDRDGRDGGCIRIDVLCSRLFVSQRRSGITSRAHDKGTSSGDRHRQTN